MDCVHVEALRFALSRLIFALGLLLLAGCQKSTPTSDPQILAQPAAGVKLASSGSLIEETWEAYSMRDPASGQSLRVGYAHTTIAGVVEGGNELIRTTSRIHTSMQRSGQTVVQDMTLTSWDTPEGRLVRFETRMSGGQGEIVSAGSVQGSLLGIDTTTLGRTQSQKIPWQADWGGLFAPEQSLRRHPLKPGEKRTIKSLLPIMNIAAETRLEGTEYETVALPAGEAKLLRVSTTIELGAQKIESVVWQNEQGETLKSLIPSIGQEAVRTTKADALQNAGGQQYDLQLASTVRLREPLANPTQTKRVVYRARLKGAPIAGLFRNSESQQVRPIDDQTVELTVVDARSETIVGTLAVPVPLPDDSSPNNFIQSDDPIIAQLATQVIQSEKDPWKLACALEKFVADAVKLADFSSAFATAAEVARSLQGDCTEHAVLLAALCRARKIPARVAFGLVYYPPQQGFAYHMWNEVWIKDRWIPLDATLGRGGIAADHIKLGDSNLSGGSPLADLLSVIQVFGRLELEVLKFE